jgi:uncharacterized membrane protein YgcG
MIRLPPLLLRSAALALLLGAFSLTPAAGQGDRSLFWRALDVEARLDADGRLHVVERHAMVFTGDWNGGERRFVVGLGQKFDFEGLERIDAVTGRAVPLRGGGTGEVDHYAFTDGTTLRWRSRLPSDPSFESPELVYVLRYTLSEVLTPQRGGYLLDHDFAFPDRPGMIQSFTLALRLDPAWSAERPVPPSVTRAALPPGAGVVVTRDLRHVGASRPAAVFHGAPGWFSWLLACSLLAGVGFLARSFWRAEHALGRFAPLSPPETIERSWLDEQLFRVPPEVAGAAWDSRVGASEVSAVLARLVAEGKLRSEVRSGKRGKPVLQLERLIEQDGFQGYEKSLVKALFASAKTTDTERIRKRYEGSGFDPAALVRPSLEQEVARLAGGVRTQKPSRRVTLTSFLAAAALLVAACVTRPLHVGLALAALLGFAIVWGIAASQAHAWRDRVWRPEPHALRFLIPLGIYTAVALWIVVAPWHPMSALVLAGIAALCLALWSSVLNRARGRHSQKGVAYRKQLAAARSYFSAELAKPHPKLEDRWYPYLLAFGLDGHVDRWFRAFGGRSLETDTISVGSSSRSSSSSVSSYSSSPSSVTSWTGGGGAFGGGGASATWAVAAGALASGVAAPSSSSSSGGSSSSSSSSSGGGGGGGW